MKRTLLVMDESGEGADDERGFVVVWLAIVLVLLLSIAALAVDLVHAYAEAQKLQNAVDAAALAGATQIPADLNGQAAKDRVLEILDDNGYNEGTNPNVQLITNDIDANNPNQMNVEVRYTFPTFFGNVMGVSTLSVRRTANGQYDAKVAMGSPANNLGDVPSDGSDSACADLNPGWSSGVPCAAISANAKQNLFLQIQGKATSKSAGGAYSSDYCSSVATDGCNGSTNAEYEANGQYYYVHNDSPGSPLVIAVYDAGFVHVGGASGSFCNGRPAKNAAPVNDDLDPNWSTAQIGNADPARHYKGSPYCAGDTTQLGRTCGSVPVSCGHAFNTQFDVLAADDTPSDPTNNPVLDSGQCGAEGAPWDIPGEALDNPPPNTLIPPQNLVKTATVSDGSGGTTTVTTDKFFQHYKVLCTLGGTSSANADYIVRVRAPNGQGSNNFSILALHDVAFPPSGNLNVFTTRALPLFAAMPTAGTGKFFVARIQPAARDRQLAIDLFDLGDSPGASNTGTIQITMENATVLQDGNNFVDCTFSDPPGDDARDPDPPWGPQVPTNPGCSVRYDRTRWNGQWATILVTIPGRNGGLGYNCNTGAGATPRDCWIKMHITPDSGVMSDATTWNARLGGAPVRLVK